MENEDYEILPHKLLEDLKYDVEALKKKLTQPDAKINELLLEVEGLKDSIHELNSIFSRVLEETKGEDPANLIKIVNEKMQAVITQNETIAKGMVAISDKLEDFMNKQSGVIQRTSPPFNPVQPVRHNMGAPQQYQGATRIAPRSPMDISPPESMSLNDFDLPPPPPNRIEKPKRGLFK